MTQKQNHLRQNILTGRWVVIAPQRSRRPDSNTVNTKNVPTQAQPQKKSQCPFCSGNEKMLPPILHTVGKDDRNNRLIRVVENKYPAVNQNRPLQYQKKGIYQTATACGKSEVIIETPLHNQDIPDMPTGQIEKLIETYAGRYKFIAENFKDIKNIVIFRNHGPASGTSLEHPHSQIIASAVMPKLQDNRKATAENYYNRNGNCPVCDVLKFESYDGGRGICQNSSFIAFVPFAAESPFEINIVPKRHHADFGSIDDGQKKDLAEMTKKILCAYKNNLSDPDYNYVIHSNLSDGAQPPYLHWYMQIKPRMTTPAGFETGSGIHINPSLPENDGKMLREYIEKYPENTKSDHQYSKVQ